MNQRSKAVALELACSAPVQQCLIHRMYTPEHVAAQAVLAAKTLDEFGDDIAKAGVHPKLVIAGFVAKAAGVIVGGDASVFRTLAQSAINDALVFQAAIDSDEKEPADESEEGPSGDQSEEEGQSEQKPEGPVGVETLELPKTVKEHLLQANLASVADVKAAIESGKIKEVHGVTDQVLAKIAKAIEKSEAPKA